MTLTNSQAHVRNDIDAIRAAFPNLDEAEANCVRMNRGLVAMGGTISYFPYSASNLSPAIEAVIPGVSR